jgi:lysyl-tRNA synthetase class II
MSAEQTVEVAEITEKVKKVAIKKPNPLTAYKLDTINVNTDVFTDIEARNRIVKYIDSLFKKSDLTPLIEQSKAKGLSKLKKEEAVASIIRQLFEDVIKKRNVQPTGTAVSDDDIRNVLICVFKAYKVQDLKAILEKKKDLKGYSGSNKFELIKFILDNIKF